MTDRLALLATMAVAGALLLGGCARSPQECECPAEAAPAIGIEPASAGPPADNVQQRDHLRATGYGAARP